MTVKTDKLANLRAMAAQKPPEPSPPPETRRREGGRPPNEVPTLPLNLRIPEDLMRGVVRLATERSLRENRVVTAQTVILDLIRDRVQPGEGRGHG